MAFLPNYKHDIFISYAHIDNIPLNKGEQGWVSIFAEHLRTQLMKRLGKKDVSLWMDENDLPGNGQLTPHIMGILPQAATFLMIVSRGYLNSEWCMNEWKEFLRLAKERTDNDLADSGLPIFLIELDKVEMSELPDEFGDLIRTRFWTEQKGGTPRTLGLTDPKEAEYYERLISLSNDLFEELKRLEKTTRASLSASTSLDATDSDALTERTVFLAEVTDDLYSRREDVRNSLKQAGFKVLPENLWVYDDLTAFNEAIEKALAQSSIFVQLLSDVVGKRPFRQSFGYPRLQYDRAVPAKKRILQWRDPNLVVSDHVDEDQRRLLEGIHVRAESIEEFKSDVKAELKPRPRTSTPVRTMGKLIYVMADNTDRKRADEIFNNPCWDKNTIGHAMLPDKGDPTELRKIFEEYLLNCDGALIIYCGAEATSIYYQVIQCRKILLLREPPIPLIGIYDGPPPPNAAEKTRIYIEFPPFHLLNCRADSNALKEFLRELTVCRSV